MKKLKIILLVLSAAYLVGVVTGPLPESTINDPIVFRLVCILCASALAVFYYGVHKRLLITWWFGWAVVVSTWVCFTVEVIGYIKSFPPLEFWINLAIAMVVGCVGLAYWGVWWRRQKSYFNIPASKKTPHF